ncbi:Homeobox-leucine zipper protein MERISTEM L1 [Nymphaea thermarum]|nr:Homeobox-leucine zipper protein MERISTEM L1 [Nymphaea thermarum]
MKMLKEFVCHQISQERLEHERLKEENSKLKVENYILQMALMSSKESNCCVCDGSLAANMTNELRCLHMENTRLKEKIIDLRNDSQLHHIPTPVEPSLGLGIGSNTGYDEPPMASSSCMIPFTAILPEFVGVSLPESEKVRALDLAMTAAHQLLRMAQGGEPLWLMAGQGDNEILNMEEYYNAFPEWTVTASRRSIGDPRIEASRDRTMVSSNPATIVRSFLDVKAWMEMFPSIVAQARIVEVIAAGVGDMGNGSLQLMNAEFQLPPPLVGARELYFLRSCNYLEMEGLWVVVDFPLDGLNYTVHGGAAASSNGYRRFPSGLVIRDLSDGRSEVYRHELDLTQVTWVEHAEIEDRALYQIILNEPVFTGRTFGARRWTERLSAYFDLMIEKLMNQSAMHGAGINSTM